MNKRQPSLLMKLLNKLCYSKTCVTALYLNGRELLLWEDVMKHYSIVMILIAVSTVLGFKSGYRESINVVRICENKE